MAITGVLMFLFLVGHLLGQSAVFAGPVDINVYGRFLHFDPTLLWIVRSVLIVAVMLHIIASVQLALCNKRARPVGCSRLVAINSSYASRTMYWSGPIVLAFIIFHLLQFTAGVIHPEATFIAGDGRRCLHRLWGLRGGLPQWVCSAIYGGQDHASGHTSAGQAGTRPAGAAHGGADECGELWQLCATRMRNPWNRQRKSGLADPTKPAPYPLEDPTASREKS